MKINKLIISQDELNQAVQLWISSKGFSLPVLSVIKEYSFQDDYLVELDTEPRVPAAVPITPADLTQLHEPVVLGKEAVV
jgi:hypothetical protein